MASFVGTPAEPDWAMTDVSDTPSSPSQAAEPRYLAMLSIDDRLCYRRRRLGGIIWQITSKMEICWTRFTYRPFLADVADPRHTGAERRDPEVVGQFSTREKM